MAFAVALQVPESRVKAIGRYLQNPVWDLYLGRKACVPTEFIFQGVFNNRSSAMEEAGRIAALKSRMLIFQVLQGEFDGDVMTLNDVPVQFGKHKVYRDRRVTIVSVMQQDDG